MKEALGDLMSSQQKQQVPSVEEARNNSVRNPCNNVADVAGGGFYFIFVLTA